LVRGDRPSLNSLYEAGEMKNKALRNRVILRAAYEFGYSQTEIARFLGMHPSSIRKLLKKIERESQFKN